MNRQEMASITSRLAANAEMVMVNDENLQENMRQKDLMIEGLKQKLRDQIAYAGKLKTLSNMDLDNARMSLKDPGMTLKNEVTEQRRKTSNYEHECINGRMVADQLRRDKDMILDNEASIKSVMENFKEENAEQAEVNYQLRLRVTEIGSCRASGMMSPTRPVHKLPRNFKKNSADYNKNFA